MSEDQNNIVTLKVRVTAEFREKIAATAKENNRSMNAEIVGRLEKSFDDAEDFAAKAELEAKVSYLEGVIKGYDSAIKKLAQDIIKRP